MTKTSPESPRPESVSESWQSEGSAEIMHRQVNSEKGKSVVDLEAPLSAEADVSEPSTDSIGAVDGPSSTPQDEEELKGCARWWPPSRTTLIKTAVLAAFVGILLFAFLYLRVHEQFGVILQWVEDNKVAGAFAFAGLYAVCVVLFVPGAILSLGAGLLFGVWLGTAVVWVGATIGQTASFPLGRFLFRDWIAAKTAKWKTWQTVEAAISQEAWKIVFLLRLAPLVPYSALNYALGLTSVGFWPYFVTSAIGIIPGTFLYTYFGSLATDIASIVRGEGGPDTTTTIITAVVSGVVIVAVLVLVTYYAKRALRQSLEQLEEGGEAAESEAGHGREAATEPPGASTP
uniref:VTT domain-containing protein n=1 Tax=Tetraselmis chuii TaxID=63592 RepID=A0A7S1SMR2_9CHLO|mmetsp:Transcript_20367/g.36335  ORF Transcript_20367/g.36335 Transcript_20367/m.36335 type:complete len:345 (+) Transcript_20367:73-1107(+)